VALPVRVAARAAAQIRQAAGWWAENRPAIPGAVRADIREALALLAQQPRIAPPYDGAKIRGVRRLFLGRIRYFVYYRVTADAVDVLAVWHASRGEQPLL
jgi:plasmid stabilization system protein ParE